MLLQENVPLAPLTTFRIGGPARFFAEAKSVGEVEEAGAFARSKNLPLFVLGGGSNLLVADSGWPGAGLEDCDPRHRAPVRRHRRQSSVRRRRRRILGPLRFACRHRAMRGRRVPERHSGKRRRHAGAECGRLRPGSIGDDRVGPGVRFERRPGARAVSGSLRIHLPLQHL